MAIEKETIEAVKTGVDLAALVQSRGIELKKNGKGLMGLCPFHNDTHPSFSVNPSTNLWQCFGCGAAGDVIRFVELFDKVDFPQAIKTLAADAPQLAAPQKTTAPKESPSLTVKDYKLFARVVDYYQHTFAEHQAGADYLKNIRGIHHNQSLKDFGTGYVNGTLPDILPEDDAVLSSLKKIGILNKNGRESFYNCVVFPLYDVKGAIVNLYGRSIDEENGIPHLYLPGKRRGLVKLARGMAKRTQTVLLTESVIDALTLYDQGFKNVVPIYGVNGLIDDHLSLFNRNGTSGIKEAYLVFDADVAGKNAAESISRQLKEKKIVPHIVNLPVKDVNLYFKRHTPEEFERLLKQAHPGSLEHSNTADSRTRTLYQETEHGFITGYGNRQYQVKGIQRGDTRLKAVVKASKDVNGTAPFELTTVDLYSSRSRIWFAKLCADLFGVSESLIREDIDKLLSLVEQYRPKETSATTPEPTKAQKQAAMGFLKNPNLFAEILSDLETLGITGEETNKLVGYLAAVSRKLDDPLSVIIQSRSAAGKSTLQDAVLSLVPEEDYVKYTPDHGPGIVLQG